MVIVVSLALAVPVTPGNVGIHQFLSVSVLGLFGVAEAKSLAFSVGFQGSAIILIVSLGTVCFFREGVRFGSLLETSDAQVVAASRKIEEESPLVENPIS